eukprot:GEMP01023665.1.p1 GENE.GEMP01023665.1~~GEMP01023665.1.p1  ORF type:complete len:327 (+),score=70.41 GEMP01023665.1:23-1003(+)
MMMPLWLLLTLACAQSAADKAEKTALKFFEKAIEEYDAEEHGNQDNFVATAVYMGLDQELHKRLQETGKKVVPRKDIGETYDGHLVLEAAKYREKAALTDVSDHDVTTFAKDEFECSDIFIHPLAYKGTKKCSPVGSCFRKHVPDFKGAEGHEGAFKVQKTPITLTRKNGMLFKDNYSALQDLAQRMKDATMRELKVKALYFVSASLEDREQPLNVDRARAIGTDYSAVYLFGGSLRFRSNAGTWEAKNGLVIFTSGVENRLELSGKRLHVRFSCDADFGNVSLVEPIPRTPGRGKLTASPISAIDGRQWFIFLFVISWMFRFSGF